MIGKSKSNCPGAFFFFEANQCPLVGIIGIAKSDDKKLAVEEKLEFDSSFIARSELYRPP